MGGDHAPGPIVAGAVRAAQTDPALHVVLVGDQAQVEPLLDVGANVSPKPEHLFQYGVMGSIFAKHILQRDKPKIGLLNIGSEEEKGHDLAKDTAILFKNSRLSKQYIGNVEGRDINKGV